MPLFHTMWKFGNKKNSMLKAIYLNWQSGLKESSMDFSQSTLPVSWKDWIFQRLGVAYCMLCRFALKQAGIWICWNVLHIHIAGRLKTVYHQRNSKDDSKDTVQSMENEVKAIFETQISFRMLPAHPLPPPLKPFAITASPPFGSCCLWKSRCLLFCGDLLICKVCLTGCQGQLQ